MLMETSEKLMRVRLKASGGALLAAGLVLAGCATSRVDPSVLMGADDAIEMAEAADAADHAPLELEEARSLRARAGEMAEQKEPEAARRLAERAALQARLALARARGSAARTELERKRSELEQLRARLQDAYGSALEEQR
ncbi:MAG: hypothetical protein RQ847_08365 [Wenzhouxiangellaceae bacterium]|nr:hypothetical protein [Wenzhouxiangellaceae bacterium]